jgi:hypothetical protein
MRKSGKTRFGENYLERLESRIGDTKSEIIIAVENIKS